MKKVDISSSAETKNDSSTNAQDKQVSQPIANEVLGVRDKFDKMVKQNKRIYLSKDAEIKGELRKRKKNAAKANKTLIPYSENVGNLKGLDKKTLRNHDIFCNTCGSINKHHPKTGYCFVCDTDNW